MKNFGIFFVTLLLIFPLFAKDQLVIGTKRFTESYILGEILAQTAIQVGEAEVEFKPGLGNTGIVFAALKEGAIDLYPEYTGTLAQEILKVPFNQTFSLDMMGKQLEPLGLGVGIPLGFNNSYALAMPQKLAESLKIHSVSDLKQHPKLKMGFSQEFLKRADGWEELQKRYGLPQKDVVGIDHSLGYEALANGQLDIIDVYSTDPKITSYRIQLLEDDKHFFPVYEAVVIYRLDVPARFPQTWKAFQSLTNTISREEIIELNVQAELGGINFAAIARYFREGEKSPVKPGFLSYLFGEDFWRLTKQHLLLVFGSLIPAILIGIPMGILAAYFLPLRHFILNFTGVIQTIPSLALLAFLIPVLRQIGTLPALIALLLYALLPIVRNTYAGLNSISEPLRESAIALGLPWTRRLINIEIPLASKTILAGIKTAAVINVGMATIAALIGAGGYGERIITGLALNNYEILLAGAIPACVLAIVIQYSFDLLDYWLIPKGIR